MATRLKNKASAQSPDWAFAFEHIEQFISKEEVESLFNQTIDFVKRSVQGKRAGFGWSGGKESIVLADIMEQSGVDISCFVYNSEMNYKSFCQWAKDNMPHGCVVYDRAREFNFAKMAQYRMEAFSENNSDYDRFMTLGHRRGFSEFCESHNLDMFIMGTRKADNNVCGKAPDYITTNKRQKWVRFSPMAEWPTEAILGYIRYFKNSYESIPPQYGYENGWKYGSDAPIYSKLLGETRAQMWQRVYRNDPELVIRASQYLKSAREYIETLKNRTSQI